MHKRRAAFVISRLATTIGHCLQFTSSFQTLYVSPGAPNPCYIRAALPLHGLLPRSRPTDPRQPLDGSSSFFLLGTGHLPPSPPLRGPGQHGSGRRLPPPATFLPASWLEPHLSLGPRPCRAGKRFRQIEVPTKSRTSHLTISSCWGQFRLVFRMAKSRSGTGLSAVLSILFLTATTKLAFVCAPTGPQGSLPYNPLRGWPPRVGSKLLAVSLNHKT